MASSILKNQINLCQSAPGTYTASWHVDWTVGPVLHGGCVAAVIHSVAETHLATDSDLRTKNQPDIVSLHLEFLRPCMRQESTITVTTIKLGAATSTIQLGLAQGGQTKVTALATSINFDRTLGPSVPVPAARALYPPARPKPNFDRVLAHEPDENWIPACSSGEVIPFARRILALDPRGGFPHEGICDAWNGLLEGQRIDSTYLAMMTDMIPSMSDTLTRNGGIYDAHEFCRRAEEWAEKNAGVPAIVSNTIAEALKSPIFNSTVTLDMEFTRRIPPEGLRFVFTRTVANLLQGGRMSVDVTFCNEQMELLCTAHQLILVLESERKFRGGKAAASSKEKETKSAL